MTFQICPVPQHRENFECIDFKRLFHGSTINVNIKLKPKFQLLKAFAIKTETFGSAVVVLCFEHHEVWQLGIDVDGRIA